METTPEFEVVATIDIPPDPGILKAIGLNHEFESAIADLVDNSIDAEADHILIRFLLKDGLVVQLLVVDDGRGMDATDIDAAMQLGRQSNRGGQRLGHFGVGLKAASFSQASVLTVLSRKKGEVPQGRRMRRESGGRRGFECEVLGSKQLEVLLNTDWPGFTTQTGTVVVWDSIRTFPGSSDAAVTDAFIETKRQMLQHRLGLTFHRLLESRAINLVIDVFDSDSGQAGFSYEVQPIDPFAYPRSGSPDYPKTLVAHVKNQLIPIECHIWPGGSDSQFFKLAGASVEQFQGFYVYRNDRLLQAGSWGGVVAETKRRKLARASVDIEDHLDLFSMSMEKSGVVFTHDLVHAIEVAESFDGVSFQDYLASAEEIFRESNKRSHKRRPMLPPGKGIAPQVKKVVERELELVEMPPIEIRWRKGSDSSFVEVDRDTQTLWLNSSFRDAVLKGYPGTVNDAPIIKTLLYLLYEDVFHGTFLGYKDRDNIDLWGKLLTAAARAEEDDQ